MVSGEPNGRTHSDLRCRRRPAGVMFATMMVWCVSGCGLDFPTSGETDDGAAGFPAEFRAIDGAGNNLSNPEWGSAGTTFRRMTEARYADDASLPADDNMPGARDVSNLVAVQSDPIANSRRASGFLWQWGQFLDHDINETPPADPPEAYDIVVPVGDDWFDPFQTGSAVIDLNRSAFEMVGGVREQVNQITAYIDASNVYGSDPDRAAELRTLDGTGRLKTSADDLLPFNEARMRNAPDDSERFFLAGDVRANEQVALTAMHTLFVREHNFWADAIRSDAPNLIGREVYEFARAMVAAEMQAITYREFLPLFLGTDALPPYTGYRGDVDAGISNEFATAAYRVGHSMLPTGLMRLDSDGTDLDIGPLALADAFFSPDAFLESGVAPVLRGLAFQPAQEVDNGVVDDVRNFLFGPPGAGGMDLAALNVQRSRDHGLPLLNDFRRAMGMKPHESFNELTPDESMAAKLAALYETVDDVELWVGGLAEGHMPDAMVGETFMMILKDQFLRLRDGDRFWYQAYLPPELVTLIEGQTLSRIIRRNSAAGTELPPDVFRLPGLENRCDANCDDGVAQFQAVDFSVYVTAAGLES